MGLLGIGMPQCPTARLQAGMPLRPRHARGGQSAPQPAAALHLASRHARLACVKVLLEAGARQLCDRQGCTPCDLAKQAGHDDVLDMVRQHEEVQAELQRQAGERQQLAAGGGAAGDEGTEA